MDEKLRPFPIKICTESDPPPTCFRGRVVNALGASAYHRIISNDSYAHDEQGVNPGQVRGFDGVLYKLLPLLMP